MKNHLGNITLKFFIIFSVQLLSGCEREINLQEEASSILFVAEDLVYKNLEDQEKFIRVSSPKQEFLQVHKLFESDDQIYLFYSYIDSIEDFYILKLCKVTKDNSGDYQLNEYDAERSSTTAPVIQYSNLVPKVIFGVIVNEDVSQVIYEFRNQEPIILNIAEKNHQMDDGYYMIDRTDRDFSTFTGMNVYDSVGNTMYNIHGG
ncbi:hypothetical protein RI065_08400 [Mycoplasmatota bacterium zrk1]